VDHACNGYGEKWGITLRRGRDAESARLRGVSASYLPPGEWEDDLSGSVQEALSDP